MPLLDPNNPVCEKAIEKTVEMIAESARKTGTPLKVVAE